MIGLSDGREYALGFGSHRIGRKKGVDIVLTDRTVSRHHADVTYEGGRYVLYDHSSNGTWVNGSPVGVAQPLRDGDTVKFGKIEFRFQLKPAAGAPRAWEQTQPTKVSGSSTMRMKGAKPRRRRSSLRGRGAGQTAKVVLLIVLLLVGAGVVVYSFFPELADRLIGLLPADLAARLGG